MKNTDELKVHGSIFFLLRKFVNNQFPQGSWEKLNIDAGTTHHQFEMTDSYPMSILETLIKTASKTTGLSENDLKEKFGEYLVPDLFSLYAAYLKPEWKTFDVLLHTEIVMHGAVRKLNSTANPPVLNVSRTHDQLLIIDYFSKRKMGCLAVGIIKGIARYYNEQDHVTVTPTTNPDDERVQIRVEFK